MKFLIVKDNQIKINLEKSVSVLNKICDHIDFEYYEDNLDIDVPTSYIDFNKEIFLLYEKLKDIEKDFVLYITLRRYDNNYFFLTTDTLMILSSYGWEHYTNLPIENGLFYFISAMLAMHIDSTVRHYSMTGCIYDFLEEKTDVDYGMKMGFFCKDCLMRVHEKINDSEKFNTIYLDVINILNTLSNNSKWNKSVINVDMIETTSKLDWMSFENEISNLYRLMGADVKQNINLSGFQIDIYVEEETPSKQKIRAAVECKFYERKVGNKIVNDFSRVVKTLIESDLIDKGIMVSYSGFSTDAFLVSKRTGIDLLKYEDLKLRVKQEEIDFKKDVDASIKKKIIYEKEEINYYPHIFVVMPFTSDLEDVYYLGIHETVKSLNLNCKKVDEMEYVGGILEQIYDSIQNSQIIIAEVSDPNPNVYYEVGYAHALNKKVILITKDVSSAPFDIQSFNHLVYKNIRDLRKKLRKRLEALL